MVRAIDLDSPTSAPQPPRRTVMMEDTEVLIDPQTNRPQPGSIIGAGRAGAHKVSWTERDIREKYAAITNYNYTGISKAAVNGVRFSFPGSGMVTLPSIVWDVIMDAYTRRNMAPNTVGSRDKKLAVGPLEPRENE